VGWGELVNQAAHTADAVQGPGRGDDRDRHQHERLKKIARDDGPGSPRRGHKDHHGSTGEYGGVKPEAEDRRTENCEPVEGRAGNQDADRNPQPGENLLIGRTEPEADRFHDRDHPALAKPGARSQSVQEEGERPSPKNRDNDDSIIVGDPRRSGERPRAEGSHEARSPGHPPGHAASAAKKLAAIPAEPPEEPAEGEHEKQIEADDGVVEVRKQGRGKGYR